MLAKNKLGRNSLCGCGSGKKYKKCCLKNEFTNSFDTRTQASMNRLREKHPDKQFIVLDSEKMGTVKISEIILEFADELFGMAATREDKEKAIMIAISAWNMSFIDELQRETKINGFIDVMNVSQDSDDGKEIIKLLQMLIDRKLTEYHSIDRFIVDYEFVKISHDDYHLNIISTIRSD